MHKDCPVLHWRKIFRELDEQIKEIDVAYSGLDEEVKEGINNFEDTDKEAREKQVKMEP